MFFSLLVLHSLLELLVRHHVWDLDFGWRHVAGIANLLELFLGDLSLSFCAEGNLEAKRAILLMLSSVAWVKAVSSFTFLLSRAASEVGVEGLHVGGSNLGRDSLGVVDFHAKHGVGS